ncbi:MAG: Gfo/Idh/MocA family oxidoreductase [Pseudomonadota bacterium]
MTRNPRIAVVGAGLIGRKHIELVAQYAHLAAIVDPDPAAKTLATEHEAHWFDVLADCLADTALDGVVVASPNQLHLAHGKACLKAGLPVLIEKPLTDTVAAGHALLAAEKAAGVPILVGHHRRHSPVIEAAKAVLDAGRLGKLIAVNALFWLNKPDDYFDVEWRGREGGGPIYINLIHDIDLLQHLCGTIISVQAKESRCARGLAVEDTGAAILEFENGVLGTVAISDTVSSPWSWELTSGENPAYPKTDQSCYLLAGTEGSLSLPDLRFWTHAGPQSWWSEIKSEEMSTAPNDPVEAQLLHFLEVIAGRTAPRVTAADGLRNIEILEALKRAAQHGGTQTIGDLG